MGAYMFLPDVRMCWVASSPLSLGMAISIKMRSNWCLWHISTACSPSNAWLTFEVSLDSSPMITCCVSLQSSTTSTRAVRGLTSPEIMKSGGAICEMSSAGASSTNFSISATPPSHFCTTEATDSLLKGLSRISSTPKDVMRPVIVGSIVSPMIGVCLFTPCAAQRMLRAASTPVRTDDENSESRSMKIREYLKSEQALIACSESLSWVCSTCSSISQVCSSRWMC
mmetsp:Transcript_15529/g.40235  ORF Transcript_15529/g.40235 Transcript_15529/m.40235 type:complete len:226 (-) Transcript_15529:296-973(-)